MTPGAIIKVLRTAEGMSQGDLARKAGVTQAYMSQLESDRRQPSVDTARSLANALGVPLAFLMLDDIDKGRAGFDSLRGVLGSIILDRMERKREK